MFVGQQISIRGFDKNPRALILLIKYLNIVSVTSKSAITPSFNGRIASILPGVLPTMRYASSPTAKTLSLARSIATTAGSFKTIPLPFICINTLKGKGIVLNEPADSKRFLYLLYVLTHLLFQGQSQYLSKT